MGNIEEIRSSARQELRALFTRATAWEESPRSKTASQTADLLVQFKMGTTEHRLGVTIRTHVRLFGADERTIYFQDTLSDEPVVMDGVETLVLSLGHVAVDGLEAALRAEGMEVSAIGDCVVPRTAEEAVFDGMKAGWTI